MQRRAVACVVFASAFINLAPSSFAQEGERKPAGTKQFIGLADYYHHSLYGKKTASGQILKKEMLTAAHRTLPFGTRVHVLNKRTGRSCIVVINDRGPFTKTKVIDLSHAAADKIGLLQMGTAKVACTVLTDHPGSADQSHGKPATQAVATNRTEPADRTELAESPN